MKGFFGLVELVGFDWYQRFMGPVAFVLFARFVGFIKFEGFLWVVELVGVEGSQRFMGRVEFVMFAWLRILLAHTARA